MERKTHKYKVGEKILLYGKEAVIEDRGTNINGLPLYKVGSQWYREDELEAWYPPCPC